MKINPEHRDTIKASIADALKRSGFASVSAVEQLYRTKNIGIGKDKAKCARWDLFYCATVGDMSLCRYVSDNLKDANQDHIDTVLKQIK